MRRGLLFAPLLAACAPSADVVDVDALLAPPPVVPAPLPETPGDGPGHTYAVSRFRFGTLADDGSFDKHAWEMLGVNLDAHWDAPPFPTLPPFTLLPSNLLFTDHCAPNPGVAFSTYSKAFTDGYDGIDNAFGSSVLPHMLSFLPFFIEENVNETVTDGGWTLLVRIDGLGGGAHYNPLAAAVYAGGSTPTLPTFGGTDEWPVYSESLDGGDLDQPKAAFAESYVSGDTWVSFPRTGATLRLRLPMLDLFVHDPLFVLELAPDRKTARGVLAGVLDPTELAETMTAAAVQIYGAPCSVFDEDILPQAFSFADIPLHGPHVPGAPCDGISIGIGLDLVEAQLGPVLPPEPPPANACPT